MSTTQKIELSREIRQWIGVGLSMLGIALTAYACIAPEQFNNKVEKLRRKLNLH